MAIPTFPGDTDFKPMLLGDSRDVSKIICV